MQRYAPILYNRTRTKSSINSYLENLILKGSTRLETAADGAEPAENQILKEVIFMNNNNPIKAALDNEGLSLREAAVRMRVSYYQLWTVIHGYPKFLPKGIVKGLANLGYNPDRTAQLAATYVKWRNSIVDEG